MKDEIENMLKKTLNIVETSEHNTRNELQMLKTLCENIETEFEGNKRMN